jgi:DNA-binding MarR family transcriptional regulator
MKKPQSDLSAADTLAIARELRVQVGRLIRRLRDQAQTGDLTGSQKAALIHLDRDGPATVTTLARAEGVRPQSMGATVAALETAGLVSGVPDPNDGRQTIWSLTTVCRNMVKASRAAREDWLFNAMQTELTSAEQEKLANAAELFKRLADS